MNVFLLALFGLVFGERIRYDGYRVVSTTVANVQHQQLLLSLSETLDNKAELYFMGDSEEAKVGATVTLAVSEDLFLLLGQTTQMVVISEDLQAEFDENSAREKLFPFTDYESSRRNNDFFESYRDYDEIIDYLDGLQDQFPTLMTEKRSVGQSYEGRDIWVYIITNQESNHTAKAGLFWQGHQHCREWIAGHSLIFTMDALVTRYGSDPRITAALDSTEFHIVPVFNPDGYVHTRTVDNMWRKNRLPDPERPNCIGTDLNRNWEHEWGTIGSSNDPCSNTFHGQGVYSSPESKNVASYIAGQTHFKGYMDWHSSGNLWMTPWGPFPELPPDWDLLKECGDAAADAIRSYRGTNFRVGNIYHIIYPVSGNAADTTYDIMGIPLSYALEIGTNFQPNAREIIPTGEEMLLGGLIHQEFVLEETRRQNGQN
eukprot:Lithocolla_globosa_v1_NODE_4631_length_1395_cov_357.856930.p1 type:complete len:429 gc:universal NODE_4631_length_1395_cov_357.856930:47-1333(+)